MSGQSVIERLRAQLVAAGLDGFIHFQTTAAHDSVTLRYLSGVGGLEDSGIVFAADSEPVLVVKDFEEARAKKHSWIRDVRAATTIPLGAAVGALGQVVSEKRLAGKKLGVDETELTLEVYLELQKLGVTLVPFGQKLAEMRMKKTEEELRRMRKAVEIAQAATQRIQSLLEQGLTELELAAEATLTIERSGASKAFVLVQFAENAALPHAQPTSRVVRGDGLLVVDLGACFEGYNSDITRTFVVGSPPQAQLKCLGAVREALRNALERAGPGVGVSQVARAARQAISRAGLPQPKHRIGHGLGLKVHEKPIVEEGFDHVLEPGNTVTIEPGVYLEGLCGARLEVDVHITENGHEVLDQATLDEP